MKITEVRLIIEKPKGNFLESVGDLITQRFELDQTPIRFVVTKLTDTDLICEVGILNIPYGSRPQGIFSFKKTHP